MTWNPGPVKFWEGVYEHPKEYFDPTDERRGQAQYLLQHPEIQALASLFVAHVCKKPVLDREVLKTAGLFFTRPVDVLQAEVDDLLRKTKKDGPKEEFRKKYQRYPMPRPSPVPDCQCPTLYSTSVESVYSSFISQSTSASTIPTVAIEAEIELTLDEAIWQMVLKALSNALNIMYAAREHDILYDEAHLCIISCLQNAVEAVWGPRVEQINNIIESILIEVRRITSEKRKLKLLMTDKLPVKVNRLRNNFKGFAESEDYPKLKKKDMMETLHARQGRFNRYPKDKFGVYVPTGDKSLDESTTYVPHGCEELEEEAESYEYDKTVEDFSLDEEEQD